MFSVGFPNLSSHGKYQKLTSLSSAYIGKYLNSLRKESQEEVIHRHEIRE